ncbi:MAG TPA: S9 family peptidase [Acidobacteriaceae bacterium]|jgi:dipeptidyl aminopeptidase/acylaminoacyl peptidase|nr:S9 family peptidase [Acidobacteriaceae bacterium]
MPGNVAISPDGTTVAWTMRSREGSALHLSSVAHPDSTNEKTISVADASNCAYGDPIWSPDGETLAFLGACTAPAADPTIPRQEQVYLWSKTTEQVRQLTHVKGEVQEPAWSPDGKTIAFLFVENATRSAGALDAMKPWSGVIGQDNIEVQRVYGVDSTTGTGDFLTPADLHVYEFDWAPNSKEIAFIAANPPGENNWWVAKLYKTEATTGQPSAPEVVLDPNTTHTALHGLQIAVPRWSPDGKRVAFIGGLMSDQGSTGGDVWVVEAKGGEPTDITPGIDGTPCYEGWISNDRIGFVEDRRGRTLLADYDVKKREPVPDSALDLGEVVVGGGPVKDAISVSRNGIFAFVERNHTGGPEIWAGPGDGLKQFTHLNDSYKPTTKIESVEWENEGFHVQGWLTLPANYDPHKRYPLIVQVHGGPSASAFGGATWSGLGYFEFEPNPRGSFGQGEAFTEANRKDFGYGDLRDIEKGMDVIEAKYPIDKNREGITGWSYGGFMTMFAVTQTHRFRAAVAGAGLSDWLSYYGENSIDQWMIPFFGASVYDDPAVYAKSSAITYIKNAKTPMLIVVGDRDGECPAPQSFEMWHALRDLGVKTELVVYPDEGHGFRNPEHQRDVMQRSIKWFADNMPAEQTVATKQ